MFKIKMAGLTIRIENRYPYVYHLCRNFWTEDPSEDFAVSATEEEILAQQAADGDDSPIGYCEGLCIYRNICLKMLEYDGFLMHGAAVAVDGQAYLFLAKSGVGKTTHIRLWLEAFGGRASVVNGDKPILRRLDGVWHVCGTPWRGKENLGGRDMVPLNALCFVERGESNAIFPMDSRQITERIFHQLLLPGEEEQVTVFFSLLEDLLDQIPCWRLVCNREPEAARIAYAAMRREG